LVAEYGMYAKVFATGGCAGRADRVAAAGGGVGEKQAPTAASGVAAAEGQSQAAAGGAAGGGSGGKAVSSGYMAGAMRELSLVVLGGGGVVLRLEAYEMASMWDKE
jgi:hypothetical protein